MHDKDADPRTAVSVPEQGDKNQQVADGCDHEEHAVGQHRQQTVPVEHHFAGEGQVVGEPQTHTTVV